MWPRLALFAAILASLQIAKAQIENTVTITNEPDYDNLRRCAQECLWVTSDCQAARSEIARRLDCTTPVVNACYCQPDLGNFITRAVNSCLAARCSVAGVGDSHSSALSIYRNYCMANGRAIPTNITPTRPAATRAIGDASSPTVTRIIITTVIVDSMCLNVQRANFWYIFNYYGLVVVVC
ncbi:hypothetical protein QBC44DRAFT_369022 [Cladorrhinum sp. PSN332]|nr:hypothetical protein QBC44DRAFT_369022 [Cladorrhinum sp. PSN332]